MPRRPSTPDHSTGREIEPVSVRSNRVSSNKIWVLNDQRLARQIGQSKPKIRKVSTSETARVSPMVSAIDRKHCPPSIGTPVRFQVGTRPPSMNYHWTGAMRMDTKNPAKAARLRVRAQE